MKAKIIDIITRDGILHHVENVIDNYVINGRYVIERVSTFDKIKCMNFYPIDFIQSVEIYDYTIND